MSENDPTIEELADGMALWEEHRPRSAEDWIAVARRCNADPTFDISKASPIFAALCIAVDDSERSGQ
jgi:hypothetical protein